jgi:predicted TIM-barrel fold metal-dependent hydrolase
VKLQPVAHGHYPIDGSIVDPVVEAAGAAGVPVVIHSDFATSSCSPHQVAQLATRYPEVTFVMLHLGLQPHHLLQVPDVVGPTRNVVVDTSQTHDLPYGVYVHTVRRLGPDRVLFGSDGPIASVEVNLTKLAVAERRYGLTAEERRCVLGANAARVFGIEIGHR